MADLGRRLHTRQGQQFAYWKGTIALPILCAEELLGGCKDIDFPVPATVDGVTIHIHEEVGTTSLPVPILVSFQGV